MKRHTIIVLLVCTSLFSWTAPESFFQLLKKKFEDFNQEAPPKTLEFIFNQSRYAPGDTAFFHVNLLDAVGLPWKGREIIQVIVSNAGGTPVLKPRYIIIDGSASHYLLLPAELNAGAYSLCGYSNRAGGSPLFTTTLIVVKDNGMMMEPSGISEISFYPEGGKLVAGVPNHVVVKATGQTLSDEASVTINSGNKVVHQFIIKENQMAEFEFTPSLTDSSFAEIKEGAVARKLPLIVSPDGCSLHLDRDRNHFVATIAIAEASKYQNKTLYMVAANRQTLGYQKSFVIENGEDVVIPIPFAELPAGLCQLSIFDSDFNVLSDELLFHGDSKPEILVTGLKENYKNRDKVDFAVSMTNGPVESMLHGYTISVVKKDLFPTQGNFTTSMEIESTDQLSLITKKNLIDWPEIVKAENVARHSSFAGLEINGKAFFAESGLPVPDSTMISGILKNGLISYEAFTSANGQFKFSFLYDFEGEDELFYVISKDGKELHNVKVAFEDESYPICNPEGNYREGASNDFYAAYSLKRNEVNRAFQFNKKIQPRPLDWNYKFEDELMGADRVSSLDQFFLMPTMAEVIKEVIPSLHVRTYDGKQTVRVLLRSDEKIPPVAIDEPLYCIDGELTKNTAYFLGLNPAEVAKVKMVVEKEKLERFGALGRNGIVIVQTKRTRPEKIPNNTTTKVMGITLPAIPSNPDYSKSKNKRIPDFRSCLYFNSFQAKVKSGTRLPVSHSFYTSDDVGEYEVRIQGRANDGTIFYWVKNFSVSY